MFDYCGRTREETHSPNAELDNYYFQYGEAKSLQEYHFHELRQARQRMNIIESSSDSEVRALQRQVKEERAGYNTLKSSADSNKVGLI